MQKACHCAKSVSPHLIRPLPRLDAPLSGALREECAKLVRRWHAWRRTALARRNSMSFAVVHSRALDALQAQAVTVEVHLANGLPSFTLAGLADTEVKESRER